MECKTREQELPSRNSKLKEVRPKTIEDECCEVESISGQNQRTDELSIKGVKDFPMEPPEEECENKRFSLDPGSDVLEEEVNGNKGLWVGRPELSAPLIYKLREKYPINSEIITKRDQGIFYRPKYMEMENKIKMAQAGLLYPDEEISDSEEEIEPDNTNCLPLRKVKYRLCDPCKPKKEKPEEPEPKPPKDLIEKLRMNGVKPPFKKLITGCQCDYYGVHNEPLTVWDCPFKDDIDMLRQHEMNKVLKPFAKELLNKNYEENPPVKFMAQETGRKKTFPVYQISNL